LVLLHWNLTKTNDGIIAAIEAKKGSGAEAGWMSIGWTKTATKMVPSDVVVGNLATAAPNNVVAYTMTSKVYPTGMQTTTAASVALSATSVETSAAGTLVKFTRKGKGIKAPIANYKAGVKNMIWAFSDTQDFTTAYHTQSACPATLGLEVTLHSSPRLTSHPPFSHTFQLEHRLIASISHLASIIMAYSRFSFLAASLAVLLLAAASCAFARHRPDAASTAAVKPPKPLACAKSTLKDYAKSVKLAKSLFFHWNITDAKDGIIAALEDKSGSGWISVGWTGSVGKMFPSDVVVGNHVSRFTGNTNDVLAYSWNGKTDRAYSKAAGGFTLSNVSILRGVGGTIVK
ncbi:unnamed protein product, partial [Closterium sp. Naga37s-1]